MENKNTLIAFEDKPIRKIWHDDEWYFSVVDVIEALTNSPSPRQYWNIVKKRDFQLSTICLQLKIKASDGKNYKTDCANTEGILRIVKASMTSTTEKYHSSSCQIFRIGLSSNEISVFSFSIEMSFILLRMFYF